VNPRTFIAELKRRNVYKVAIAYAVVAWLLMQVASQIFPFFEIPNWAVRLVVLLLIIGFPVAMILAWAFELTPEGIKRTEDTDATRQPSRGRAWIYILVIGAALSVGLFFLGRYTSSKQSEGAELLAKSIAVLPFVDMSQAKDQEYFCDGISEEILDALAKIEGLRVVARTSSFSFKGKNPDMSEIGQKLNVENVLEGSLRREGNRIRVTAQLVNARDGFHIWSETFERELQGVFAVQDEITRSIVDALKIKLAVAPSPHPHQNTEAYDLYLQGLYLSNKSDEQSLRKSLDLFQGALDKDPNLARAWTGIAKDWGWLADAYVKPLEAWPKVKEAALKALAIDERDAEAHIRLGGVKGILDWDPAGEKAELKRALELDPNSASARESLGWLLACEGDTNQGVFLLSEAKKLDPLSSAISYMLTWAYLAADRFDDAIAEGQRTLQLDPSYSYLGPPIAIAYREKGELEKAITLYAKRQEATHSPSAGLAVTYARMGRQVEARRILDQLLQEAQTRYIPADSIAGVYAELGEKDEAFRWLERAYTEHSSVLRFIGISHTFRSLRADPRFADLLKRMGFDPAKVLRQQEIP
jgi:adenylate cyclase